MAIEIVFPNSPMPPTILKRIPSHQYWQEFHRARSYSSIVPQLRFVGADPSLPPSWTSWLEFSRSMVQIIMISLEYNMLQTLFKLCKWHYITPVICFETTQPLFFFDIVNVFKLYKYIIKFINHKMRKIFQPKTTNAGVLT